MLYPPTGGQTDLSEGIERNRTLERTQRILWNHLEVLFGENYSDRLLRADKPLSSGASPISLHVRAIALGQVVS